MKITETIKWQKNIPTEKAMVELSTSNGTDAVFLTLVRNEVTVTVALSADIAWRLHDMLEQASELAQPDVPA